MTSKNTTQSPPSHNTTIPHNTITLTYSIPTLPDPETSSSTIPNPLNSLKSNANTVTYYIPASPDPVTSSNTLPDLTKVNPNPMPSSSTLPEPVNPTQYNQNPITSSIPASPDPVTSSSTLPELTKPNPNRMPSSSTLPEHVNRTQYNPNPIISSIPASPDPVTSSSTLPELTKANPSPMPSSSTLPEPVNPTKANSDPIPCTPTLRNPVTSSIHNPKLTQCIPTLPNATTSSISIPTPVTPILEPPQARSGSKTSPFDTSDLEEVVSPPPSSLRHSGKSGSSLGLICRICHEGETAGTLLRPCRCAGTMAYVHRVCLERWLNLATSEACELCGYQFNIRYSARPCWEFLLKCDNAEARRALKVDICCLLFLTPMAILSVYLCSVGALQYTSEKRLSFAIFTDPPPRLHNHGRIRKGDLDSEDEVERSGWEGLVLVVVAIILIIIYTCWASFTLKYHIRVWRQWRVVHQDAILACVTPPPPPPPTPSQRNQDQDPESPRPLHVNNGTTNAATLAS